MCMVFGTCKIKQTRNHTYNIVGFCIDYGNMLSIFFLDIITRK